MKKKNHTLNLGFKIFTYTYLMILAILVVFPFLLAIASSLKQPREILVGKSFWPEKMMFENYIMAWKNSGFSKYFFNSAWYSIASVAISVYISAMCGYIFARGEFRGKNVLFAVFTSMMFITLGTSTLYPSLQILKALGLNTSLQGLLFRQLFSIPIANIFMVRGYMNGVPKSLDEAAEIEGCSFIGTFFKIMLPIMKPIIATVAIFAFSAAWNDYLMPMIVTLNNPSQRTLAVGLIALKNTSSAATAWNVILAGGMISAVPMIVVFLVFNKYFIQGLTSGAVKG